jgi:hypothetical protein
VINKFGEIKISNNPSDQITVDVKVKIEASTESKVEGLMKKIDVKFSKTGTTARAETVIENNLSGSHKLNIDYVINIPSDKNLEVSNKYGNTVVDVLKASGKFDIQYGNLTAAALVAKSDGNMKIALAYGKSTIGTTGNLGFDIKYSNATINEAGNIEINSAYSVLNIDKAEEVKVTGKYDSYSFGNLFSLNASTKYTNFKISEIKRKVSFDSAYGSIRVDRFEKSFESAVVNSSYGAVILDLGTLNYSVEASCSYCGIKYPQERYSGDKIKDDFNISLKGKVGNEKGGMVKIVSKYGEIKLIK